MLFPDIHTNPISFTFSIYEDSYGTVYTDLLSSGTSKIENVNDIGLVWISGNSTEDETLTATVSDEDGYLNTSVTYKWYRSGTSVVVGTESTYRLTQSDVDSTLLVSVSYEDSYGTVYTGLLSSATSKIENVNDIGLDIHTNPISFTFSIFEVPEDNKSVYTVP